VHSSLPSSKPDATAFRRSPTPGLYLSPVTLSCPEERSFKVTRLPDHGLASFRDRKFLDAGLKGAKTYAVESARCAGGFLRDTCVLQRELLEKKSSFSRRSKDEIGEGRGELERRERGEGDRPMQVHDLSMTRIPNIIRAIACLSAPLGFRNTLALFIPCVIRSL